MYTPLKYQIYFHSSATVYIYFFNIYIFYIFLFMNAPHLKHKIYFHSSATIYLSEYFLHRMDEHLGWGGERLVLNLTEHNPTKCTILTLSRKAVPNNLNPDSWPTTNQRLTPISQWFLVEVYYSYVYHKLYYIQVWYQFHEHESYVHNYQLSVCQHRQPEPQIMYAMK